MNLATFLRLVLRRNKLLIGIIAVVFFAIMILSAVVTYILLLSSPGLTVGVEDIVSSSRSYVAIPPPYTRDLYFVILLNNIGHFWNPIRIWVWVTFVGAFSLGYELLLNAIVIGAVASFIGLTKSAAYAVAGLTPHGIFEIPAFILEFAGLARWHVTTTRAFYEKLSGGTLNRPPLIEGFKDTLTLSLLSLALFVIAAYIETYITPRFLGL